MRYKILSKSELKVSTIGLGCMRLPTLGDDSKIDENKAIELIRGAIDSGINYIDTAYFYHGGNAERVLGLALSGGYREKVILTTKLPLWMVDSPCGMEKLLDEQLSRLGTSYIDFYLLHSLNHNYWSKAKEFNYQDFLDRMIAKGKIRFAGFSFHDDISLFKEIIDSYDWKLCQVQFNLIDYNYQAGITGIRYAHSKNIPVVVMEPLKGGTLINNVPRAVESVMASCKIPHSKAEWALKYLANIPEIDIILSGITTLEQLSENAKCISETTPGSLTDIEVDALNQMQLIYQNSTRVPCGNCGYCLPCPRKVKINAIFELYNSAVIFDEREQGKELYRTNFIDKNRDASCCISCGKCETHCPQAIAIMSKLREADEYLR